ncbi:MAG TPA: helix-turn-helix domain-containing protein [Xanthobacteraceae bacterium]|jgi:hypothetical protein|nr:helix-turn-helix domain-containing protein [Xanthobacteraceae bacterium]
MTPRGPRDDHVVIRLADEGVPVAAIARAIMRPADELRPVIANAVERGYLVAMPASDWPPGSRRDTRMPTVSALRMGELGAFVGALQRTFALAAGEARFLALLVQRGEAARPSLHAAISGDEPESDPKTVDIHASRIRKKLRPYGIALETIWGRGYALSPAAVRAIRLQVDRVTRHGVPAGMGPVSSCTELNI